ncbi:hypothetical protein C0991_002623 [Blastosporella zonata]|nr:hypothetical protein C0991_002623 [Blastosporella zonata]
MYSAKSSVYLHDHSGSPVSGYSYSSWGTVGTATPGTPYLCPVPLPRPTTQQANAQANPLLQHAYDLRSPPPPASRASLETAVYPPTASMHLLLSPRPSLGLPALPVSFVSPTAGPISVSALLEFLYATLNAPADHNELRSLKEGLYPIVKKAYEARVYANQGMHGQGVRRGDRMGGAWVVVGVVPIVTSDGRKVWEVRLDLARR